MAEVDSTLLQTPDRVRVATFLHYYPEAGLEALAQSLGLSEDRVQDVVHQLVMAGILRRDRYRYETTWRWAGLWEHDDEWRLV